MKITPAKLISKLRKLKVVNLDTKEVFPWGAKIVAREGANVLVAMQPEEYRGALKELGMTASDNPIWAPGCALTTEGCKSVGCKEVGGTCDMRSLDGGRFFCICKRGSM